MVNRSIVRLPDQLKEAIDNIIADKSVAALYQSAKELNNHLVFKKPPMRAEDLNVLKLTCKEEVDKCSPLPIGTLLFLLLQYHFYFMFDFEYIPCKLRHVLSD